MALISLFSRNDVPIDTPVTGVALATLSHPARLRIFAMLRRLLICLVPLGSVLSMSGPVSATDLEQQARELEAMLIAPCCFSQRVSVHLSPAADEVRQDIRMRLAAGETRDQILDAYVARYGNRILAEPPAEGMTRVLYVLPPLVLVLTAALVVVVIRRFTGSRADQPQAADSTPVPAGDRYGAELDDELRDLD